MCRLVENHHKRGTVARFAPSASKIGLALVKCCGKFQNGVYAAGISGNAVPGFLFSSSVARLYTLRRIIRPHAGNAFVRR